MTLGTRVREARVQSGISQKLLGAKLGASQHYVSDIERDVKHPSEAMLRKLAAALGTTPEELAYGPPPRERQATEALTPEELSLLAEGAEKILQACDQARRRLGSDRSHRPPAHGPETPS